MAFGKHKGVLVCELPDEYLDWLHTRELREPLRSAVLQEWRWRFAAADRTTADTRRMAESIIATGYRTLALEHHPDRGGATETMQAVNAAASWLRQTMRMVSA
jgi:Putative quorum-sensing-regulated virulence factor